MPVKLALVAVLAALSLSGGICPKGSALPDDLERSGLMAYIARGDSSSTLYYTNFDGSIQGVVGLGLSPALAPTSGVTLSAQRGRVAFAMLDTAGGKNDIFVINRDGSGLLDLTVTSDVDESDPDWSRAGELIAYAADGDIWTIGTDGNYRQNVTRTPDIVEADPTFSPDGTQIAFTVDPNSATSQIVVLTVADGSRRVVVNEATLDASEPSWSPSSGRIAFTGRRTEGVVREEVDLWVVSALGAGLARITDAHGDLLCRCPAWAPKEDHLVFRGTPLGALRSDLYTIDPDGSGLSRFRQTTGTSEVYVDWR